MKNFLIYYLYACLVFFSTSFVSLILALKYERDMLKQGVSIFAISWAEALYSLFLSFVPFLNIFCFILECTMLPHYIKHVLDQPINNQGKYRNNTL